MEGNQSCKESSVVSTGSSEKRRSEESILLTAV
jgi:hypothetical protein